MKTSRRKFIKTGSVAIVGAAIRPSSLIEGLKKKKILGIQLYTVRDAMQKDPRGTLQQLADMGYRYVEHANYVDRKFYGYNATDFRKLLGDLGLKMPSGHVAFTINDWNAKKKDFTDQWKYTLEDAAAVGQDYLINPWMEEPFRVNYEKLMPLLDLFNECGSLCKKFDLDFGYHNHDFEFNTMVKNKRLYEIILSETDPKLVAQQMDIGNMFDGGGKPIEVLKTYPGRFKLLHVKDEIKSDHGELGGEHASTVLGKGVMPVKSIIDLAKKIGKTSYFIIEQETYQSLSPLESAKENYTVMRNWGY